MKSLSISVILSVVAVMQCGCTNSPPRGAGGMAEHHLDSYIPVEAEHELTPEHGLRFDFELLRRQLDILVLEGAEYCFPASVVLGRENEQRIARELYGKLYYDAANDILIQRHNLARLERQLDAVGRLCRPPEQAAEKSQTTLPSSNADAEELRAELLNLLNSDNQFAVDSYQLNPKYLARLAQAAGILRQHRHYHLRIIGHADYQGSNEDNMDLSLQRAQQVARYLSVMGISPSRISSEAKGETAPLFPGKEPHVRLVNRRVTIELLDSPEPRQTQSYSQTAI